MAFGAVVSLVFIGTFVSTSAAFARPVPNADQSEIGTRMEKLKAPWHAEAGEVVASSADFQRESHKEFRKETDRN